MTIIPRRQASDRPIALFRAAADAHPAAPPQSPAHLPEASRVSARSEAGADASLRRIEELEALLASERRQHEKDREAAFARGREEGLAHAARRDDERLTLLREAIAGASAASVARVEEQADLAVVIARAALQRIFGAHWQHPQMVEAVIRNDALALTAGSVIRIRVSREDYPDADALAALAAASDVEIAQDGGLASGACVFELTLGSIDASIPVQARAADELLAGLLPRVADPA